MSRSPIEKLARLIPRLGTTFDGERLATVAAIERTLRNAGLDWHALAAAIERQPAPVRMTDCRYEPVDMPETVSEVAQWCLSRGAGRLSDREVRFLRNMLTWPGSPSSGQRKWLADIFASLGGQPW